MRLLITGSRTWVQANQIEFQISRAYWSTHLTNPTRRLIVIHGGCKQGADQIASDYTRKLIDLNLKVNEVVFLPEWTKLGNSAGPKRNEAMVNEGKPDICLAFIDKHSRGATHCANYAASKGIPTYVWTDNTVGTDNYFQL